MSTGWPMDQREIARSRPGDEDAWPAGDGDRERDAQDRAPEGGPPAAGRKSGRQADAPAGRRGRFGRSRDRDAGGPGDDDEDLQWISYLTGGGRAAPAADEAERPRNRFGQDPRDLTGSDGPGPGRGRPDGAGGTGPGAEDRAGRSRPGRRSADPPDRSRSPRQPVGLDAPPAFVPQVPEPAAPPDAPPAFVPQVPQPDWSADAPPAFEPQVLGQFDAPAAPDAPAAFAPEPNRTARPGAQPPGADRFSSPAPGGFLPSSGPPSVPLPVIPADPEPDPEPPAGRSRFGRRRSRETEGAVGQRRRGRPDHEADSEDTGSRPARPGPDRAGLPDAADSRRGPRGRGDRGRGDQGVAGQDDPARSRESRPGEHDGAWRADPAPSRQPRPDGREAAWHDDPAEPRDPREPRPDGRGAGRRSSSRHGAAGVPPGPADTYGPQPDAEDARDRGHGQPAGRPQHSSAFSPGAAPPGQWTFPGPVDPGREDPRTGYEQPGTGGFGGRDGYGPAAGPAQRESGPWSRDARDTGGFRRDAGDFGPEPAGHPGRAARGIPAADDERGRAARRPRGARPGPDAGHSAPAGTDLPARTDPAAAHVSPAGGAASAAARTGSPRWPPGRNRPPRQSRSPRTTATTCRPVRRGRPGSATQAR